MSIVCDGHRVVAVLFAGGLTVDMSVLEAVVLAVPGHLAGSCVGGGDGGSSPHSTLPAKSPVFGFFKFVGLLKWSYVWH